MSALTLLPWFSNISSIPKAPDVQIAEVKTRLFSDSWLAEPDVDGGFPTNGDRFAAQELKKRQDPEAFTRTGFVCQAIAAGWHHKGPEQLRALGDAVGRERIQVMHGTIDNMVTFPHAQVLVQELGGEEQGVTYVTFEGRGHVLQMEERKGFASFISAFVDKTENL